MGALNSLATLGLNVAMAQQSSKAKQDQAKANAEAADLALADERARKAQDLMAEAADDTRSLDRSLSRRLSEERARAGAAGISSTGGSIDAVLRGLTNEAAETQASSDAKLKSRLAGLDASFERRSRKNLLDTDTSWLDAGARALSALGGGRRRSLLD